VLSAGGEDPLQIIEVQLDDPEAQWQRRGLLKQDVNFDGHPDIGVLQPGGAKWGWSFWWLYDSRSGRYYANSLSEELYALAFADFEVDPVRKRLRVTRFVGASLDEYLYEVGSGHLLLAGYKRLIGPSEEVFLTVATVCMNAKADKKANLKTFASYIRQAAEKGAQLVVFPEIALQQNPGWNASEQPTPKELAYVRDTAETIPGPSTDALVGLVKKHNIYVIFGMTEISDSGELYNAGVFLGPGGVIGKYRKRHLNTGAAGNEDLFWEPGDEIGIFRSPLGRVGLMISGEMERHYGAKMADARADLIVTLAAWPPVASKWYDRLTRSNALEAARWHVIANQTGPVGHAWGYGHSRIVDPDGVVAADTGAGEGMKVITTDLPIR
jgi:predicted amidohydrolase